MATLLGAGYINLTVKYSDAMDTVAKDITGMAGKAGKQAGEAAGSQLSGGLDKAIGGVGGTLAKTLGGAVKSLGPAVAVGADTKLVSSPGNSKSLPGAFCNANMI